MIDWRIRDPKKDFRVHGKGPQRDRDTLQKASNPRRRRGRGKNAHVQTNRITTTLNPLPSKKKDADEASSLLPIPHSARFVGLTQFNAPRCAIPRRAQAAAHS